MIEVCDLRKSYEHKKILEHMTIKLENSNIYALVGKNGVGKTTLLTSLIDASFRDKGDVKIDGISNHLMGAKENLFYVPDQKDMFLHLTGEEYLRFIVEIYHQRELDEQLGILVDKLHMQECLHTCIAKYSLGMKQKLYMMAAFLSGADNLIFDEPFNGLDPESVFVIKDLMKRYRDSGKMILFSVHNLDLVSNFSDTIIFLDKHREIFMVENTNDIQKLEFLFFEKCV